MEIKKNLFEAFLGIVTVIFAVFFLYFAYSKKENISDGYKIYAVFDNIEGISVGSDVMIAGIKVGEVLQLSLDKKDYSASVALKLNKDIKIPEDSRLSVVSSGLLGGKYILVTPGMSEIFIKEGSALKYTQSAINLESLIGKIINFMKK